MKAKLEKSVSEAKKQESKLWESWILWFKCDFSELWYIHLHISPLNLSCCYLREPANVRVVTSDAAQSSRGKCTLPVLLSDGFHWGTDQRVTFNTSWVAAGDRDSKDRFYLMARIAVWSVQLTLFITVQKTKWLEERNKAGEGILEVAISLLWKCSKKEVSSESLLTRNQTQSFYSELQISSCLPWDSSWNKNSSWNKTAIRRQQLPAAQHQGGPTAGLQGSIYGPATGWTVCTSSLMKSLVCQ